MIGKPRAPRPTTVTVHKDKSRGRYVVLCFVTEAGARRRYRQSYETRQEADGQADTIRARLRNGLPPFETPEEVAPGFTHSDALALYEVEHVNDETTPEQSRKAMIDLRQMIERFPLAKVEAEAATLRDLLDYRNARKAAAKAAKPKQRIPGDATIGKNLKHLRAALKHAKRRKRIVSHIFEKLEPEDALSLLGGAWKPEDTKGKVIPPEDRDRLFAALNPRALRMARFMAETGVRKGEAATLDWAAHFKSLPFPHFAPIVQKGCKPRKIPFESVAGIVGPKRSSGLVFGELGPTWRAIYDRFTNCWEYAEKKAKVPHYRPHDTRHTFGSEARRRDSLEDVAAVMGITAQTAKTYADHEKDDLTLRLFAKRAAESATNLPHSVSGAASESN